MGRNFFNTSGDAGETATTEGAADAGAQVDQTVATQAAAEQDAEHGQGGLYEMRDGRRVLIERTAQEGPAA